MSWRGTWDSAALYAVNDGVSYGGSSYIALAPNLNAEPPAAGWNVLASKGDPGERGLQGSPGRDGDRGDVGPKGHPGDAGAPGTIWRGEWQAGLQYGEHDVVRQDGPTYIAVSDNVGQSPAADVGVRTWARITLSRGDYFVFTAVSPSGQKKPTGFASTSSRTMAERR